MGRKKQAALNNVKFEGTQPAQVNRKHQTSIKFDGESIAEAYLHIRQEMLTRNNAQSSEKR
ncbi:hypothetical protein [Azonexus sp. IMCC34839]|uniref:hypothetical protein n=1 Tax=Azonexus sp. IMCC34839 TaxID=3133695 RepID=UPI00399C1BC6